VQYNFHVDGPFVRTIIQEQIWKAQSDATGKFYTVAPALNWTCDPTCGGNQVGDMQGASPLLSRINVVNGTALANPPVLRAANTLYTNENLTASTQLSTFTWPAWGDGGPFYSGVRADAIGENSSLGNPTTWKPNPTHLPSQLGNNPQGMAELNFASNQDFKLFVSSFYYYPAPSGWSIAKGDTNPFA
jgi:hypothetical protein